MQSVAITLKLHHYCILCNLQIINQVINRENQPCEICITRMKKNEVEGCVTYISGLVGGSIPTSTIMEKTNRVGIASIDL